MIIFTIDPWQVVQLIVAVVLPVLVGLVTTRSTSPGIKAAALAGIAVATSLGTEALAAHEAGVPYDLGQGLLFGLGSFIVAVAMHYGLWKPTGASAVVQHVGSGRAGELPDVTERDEPADVPTAYDSSIEDGELPGDWSGADDESVGPYTPEH